MKILHQFIIFFCNSFLLWFLKKSEEKIDQFMKNFRVTLQKNLCFCFIGEEDWV